MSPWREWGSARWAREVLKQVVDQPLHAVWAAASALPVALATARGRLGPAALAGLASLGWIAAREWGQWPSSRPWDPWLDWTSYAAGIGVAIYLARARGRRDAP